jgi:PEP-CTERM motif
MRFRNLGLLGILSLALGNANAALFSRLNGQAVYDSDLNITWTANANLAATLPFGLANVLPSIDSGNQPGSILGNRTDSWIGALNVHQGTGYLGFSDWRLTTSKCGGEGYICTDSEFGHLFYDELGGSAHQPINSSGNSNLSLFSNIAQNNWYWTGTLTVGEKYKVFSFGEGARSETFGTLSYSHVWAVRDGDVSVAAVPEPETYMMILSGLTLIGAIRRKKPKPRLTRIMKIS